MNMNQSVIAHPIGRATLQLYAAWPLHRGLSINDAKNLQPKCGQLGRFNLLCYGPHRQRNHVTIEGAILGPPPCVNEIMCWACG